MVLKTEVCRFSGLKIYPGHGMRLTKIDSQTYLFLSAKCKRLFNLRLRPAKLAWTTQYRKAHKKDAVVDAARKKKRSVRLQNRSLVSANLELITKKRAEKPEVRAAAREAALREIKERNRKNKGKK
ncbi:uncharacterized protein MICPUCDRAFT_27633 [Micromonas pusilla CCMP1545]|uniref:Predicted protein n=2 Tax=Micromonas pusilla TaxID=38833 RepID=C1MVX2_MICPC|nr:uncharacterized protein MICPUCDRAFT_27633 [Micromonas pusilla CCMP1545]EEH56065.1 predicted protein [Micromonas pusilla CCMP1545]|mmetsp:Transcript_689/g.2243  ORF Transcript_689/g.2243 Transcript_689/m.2243 type:complete len:126 (+) Transcript_689:81-458(+)|eukprot:XP_003060113.1 predicted protein [Micromonas pusilla CCMP1545]